MNTSNRFQAGGPRQAVYGFLAANGFVMSKRSDKEWTWGERTTLFLYGAGSMAKVYSAAGNFEGPLEEAVNRLLQAKYPTTG